MSFVRIALPSVAFAVALVLLVGLPGSADDCTQPDSPPRVEHAAKPEMPIMAAQMGISGDVAVDVSLDENSHVIGTKIWKSPSKILNAAAIQSARKSVYRTAIHNCMPIPSTYRFVVTFGS